MTLQRFWVLAALITGMATGAMAELRWNEGAVAHRSLPDPLITRAHVMLNVPHLRQGRDLCVPASAAMILSYFGESHDQRRLKALAENHKPPSQRNSFTYWSDMDHALRQIGHRWDIRTYPKTNAGFLTGLRAIQRHLRKGLPVMIEVHQDVGHTFVVVGYDDTRQIVYVRDPNLPARKSRILSYGSLQANWHNHAFGDGRSAFFSKR